jgi:hypothetical protein
VLGGLGLLLVPALAMAADDWQLRADGETWRLPADESMGVVRLALRRRVTPWLAVGVDGSAAVRGSRGGFITLGFGGEASIPLAARWDAQAGLALGAGGGRGGYLLTGGGLEVRADAGVRYRLTHVDAIAAGVSRVEFPNGGAIRSTQLYLGWLHGFETVGDSTEALTPGTSVPSHQFSLFAEPLRIEARVLRVDGTPQRDFGLVGAQWRTTLHGRLYARLAAGGAASGASSGYMQALAGVGYRWPLTSRLAAQAALSIGAGGGGGVDTGGGFLAEAAGGVAVAVTRHESIELDYVRRKAPSAAYAASGLALRIAHRFGADDEPAAPAMSLAMHPVRVRFVDQQYRGTSAAWNARPNREFGTLGVAADYFIGPSLFVTGQGLAAYSGQNGAYMIGLAGAGWHQPLGGRFHAELEVLGGAAGGGGAAVGSGAVAQLNGSIGWQSPNGLGVALGVGRLEARRGAFAADVISLAVSWRTSLATRGD